MHQHKYAAAVALTSWAVSFGRHLGKPVAVKVSKGFDTVLHHIIVSTVFSLEAEQPDGKIPGEVVCLRGCWWMGHALSGGLTREALQGLELELFTRTGLFNISINDLEETVECAFTRTADVDKVEQSGLDCSCCEAAQLGLAHPGDEVALEAPNSVFPPPHPYSYGEPLGMWSHGLHNRAWWTRKNGTSWN